MLIYKTMVLRGSCVGELASITVGRLHLDSRQAHAGLLAKDAKAGQRALLPLREDLVDDLRDWLDEKLKARRDEQRRKAWRLRSSCRSGRPCSRCRAT